MEHRDLVNGYLDEAWTRHPDAGAGSARLEFLRTEKQALWEEVKDGDWAATQSSYNGRSSAHARGITAGARFRAVKEALDILIGDPAARVARLGILTPRYHHTPLG